MKQRIDFMKQLSEVGNYDDKQLDDQIKLSNTITNQDLDAFGKTLRLTLVGYIIVLVLLALKAIFWQSIILSVIFMLFFVFSFLTIEHYDRKSDRSLKRYSALITEKRVRIAYELGFENGKQAAKTVAKRTAKTKTTPKK